MLVLATFLSIGAVFIAFLFRFLFALESELRSKKNSVRVERIWSHRASSRAVANGSAPALFLVHSVSSEPSYARREAPVGKLYANENSRIKKEA